MVLVIFSPERFKLSITISILPLFFVTNSESDLIKLEHQIRNQEFQLGDVTGVYARMKALKNYCKSPVFQ